jgi:hypothetical protein
MDFDFSDAISDSDRIKLHDHVIVRAVTDPLVARARPRPEESNKTPKSRSLMLIRRWRHRLVALRKAGWEQMQDKKALQYARNCLPSGVYVDKGVLGLTRPRLCMRPRVCPFCYGRLAVRKAYGAAEWALYGGTPDKILSAHLVGVRRSWTFPARTDLKELLDRLAKARKAEAEKFGALGAATVVTVAPDREGFKVRRLVLMVVPHRREMPKLPKDAQHRVLRESKITKRRLAALTAWTMAYPLGMMFGDARRAVEILRVTAETRQRQYSASGVMRNAEDRRRGAA